MAVTKKLGHCKVLKNNSLLSCPKNILASITCLQQSGSGMGEIDKQWLINEKIWYGLWCDRRSWVHWSRDKFWKCIVDWMRLRCFKFGLPMLEWFFSYHLFQGCFYFLNNKLQWFKRFHIFLGSILYLNGIFQC